MCLLVVGCAEFSVANEDVAAGGGQDDTLSLRIDVYPSNDLASERLDEGVSLMEQSFRLENEELDALPILQMKAPVVFEGLVIGFEAYPTNAQVSVPGMEAVPVEADIRAYAPGTPMGRTAISSADDGSFQLQLTPTDWTYQLAVVPRDPATLPFIVEPEFLVTALDDGDLNFELEYGVPLYGQITQGEAATALSGLHVQAFDIDTGIGGPIVETDEDGIYDLRVYPGSYWLKIDGDAAAHLPDKTLLAEVGDSQDGLRLDTSYGASAPITVLGEVQDADGRPLQDVQVRFTSVEIYDDPGAEFEVAVTTGGGNGAFSLRLLPGQYTVEFIPPYDEDIGPLLWPEIVELTETYTELNGTDPIVLEGRPVVEQQIFRSGGDALSGVIVRAVELGFDGYAYTTVTGENGYFSLDVAAGDLQWSFSPSQSADGTATFLQQTAEELQSLEKIVLPEGLTVRGCIQYEDIVAAYMPLDVRDSDDRLYATSMTDILGCFSVQIDWSQASPDDAVDTGG
jgi:hypothetical protein